VHVKSVIEQRYSNSNSTTKHLKHSLNVESVENVRSSNVVKFEFELRHISNQYQPESPEVTKTYSQQHHAITANNTKASYSCKALSATADMHRNVKTIWDRTW